MKKIFLSLIYVSFLLSSNAQLTKNNWLVGGSGSFSYTDNNIAAYLKYKSLTLSITPKIGYFFIDKFVAGVETTVSIYKTTYPPNTTSYGSKIATYSFGPFARYYLLNAEKTYNIFIEGAYQHQIQKHKTLSQVTKQSANSYIINAGPVVYFNSSVGIEFTVGFSSLKLEGLKGSNNSLLVGIGFQIHLEKEKNN